MLVPAAGETVVETGTSEVSIDTTTSLSALTSLRTVISEQNETKQLTDSDTTTQRSGGADTHRVSVQEISPPPRRQQQPKKRKRNTMEATILTASPFKNAVAARLEAKKSAVERKLARKEQKKTKSSSKSRSVQSKARKLDLASESAPKCTASYTKGSKQRARSRVRTVTGKVPGDTEVTYCLVCGEASEKHQKNTTFKNTTFT